MEMSSAGAMIAACQACLLLQNSSHCSLKTASLSDVAATCSTVFVQRLLALSLLLPIACFFLSVGRTERLRQLDECH